MRQRAKVDANHTAIVAELRARGASVQSLAAVGYGCPDILCGIAGRTYLCEIKDGSKPPSKRKLTPDQEAWHQAWRGGPVLLLTSVEDAARAVRNLEGRNG